MKLVKKFYNNLINGQEEYPNIPQGCKRCWKHTDAEILYLDEDGRIIGFTCKECADKDGQ